MEDAIRIPREHYISTLRKARDTPFIKILTGIRRCGKSTLMEMFIDELRRSGVSEDRILHIDLDGEGSGIGSYRDLIDAVGSKISDLEGSYLFFDGIRNVPEWERAIATFYAGKADIYITGSGSDVFSSEFSTRLSGRTLGIRIQPLAFSEYLDFRRSDDVDALLDDFIRYGGFPAVASAMDRMPELAGDLLDGIYNTVFNKDVTGRHPIRGNTKISRLATILMRNIGNRTSVRSVASLMTDRGIRMQPQTVDEYIGFLEEALLFGRVPKFDPKTRNYIVTSDRFYVADPGLRNSQLPYCVNDLGSMLENIVFNELVYRYGDVAVCGIDKYEVDFVADPMHTPSYYQVVVNISDANAREKVLRPLRAIPDNYPKTIVTYDRFPMDDIDGIRIVQLKDWLLESR